MAVHPQAQAFLDQAEGRARAATRCRWPTPAAMFEAMAAMSGPPEAVASVDDRDSPRPGRPDPRPRVPPRTPTDAPLPVTM